MTIGIDASRAFLSKRTGIEEYSYQVIKHLRDALPREMEVILYMRPGQGVDFTIPKHWKIKRLWAPYLWTQIRLSLEMLFRGPGLLFVPAHTVPLFHPRKTFVTIHGLEYEFCPEGYGFFERLYMRWSIRYSCLTAKKIITVSQNTKKDLVRLYHIREEKIIVLSEGFNADGLRHVGLSTPEKKRPYLLFIGRLEIRKNILRIIEAFELFKTKTGSNADLILAGKFGYGMESIQRKIDASPMKASIHLPGFITEDEKWELLKNAQIFLFPTLYEGFGIPVLEAQAAGTAVITSNTSSLPEVAGSGALLVDPLSVEAIAQAIEKLVTDVDFKADIIEKGRKNSSRFSWERLAHDLARIFQE